MKTKELLKEWREFLTEGVKEKFKKNDVDKKVKITTCCPMCKKFTGVDVGKELKGNWTLKAINTNDVKIGKNKENLVVVKLENKEKKIPQCCVSLK
jgi:hypothetical protein